jgi:inosine-uridine nucleoside N-ribohydrolase
VRLWIDTDIGRNPDDAVALLVATAHPDVDLVGVSITGDDPPNQAGTTRTLLAWAGHDHVPVLLPEEAVAALAGARADVVVAIGPLTNIAHAGRPPVPLVIMGGTLHPVEHRGKLHRVEWNFSRDPAAAAAVLAGGTPCTLVPLDATVATRLDPTGVDALVAAVPPLGPLISGWLADLAGQGVPAGAAAVHLHDPAAVLVAAGDGPAIGAHRQALHLAVEPDGRLVEDPAAPCVDVVTRLDGPAVGDRALMLLRGMNGA